MDNEYGLERHPDAVQLVRGHVCGWTCIRNHLKENHLTGVLPASLSDLGALQSLSMGGNQSTGGTIPALPAGLATLILNDDQLTGTIPALPDTLVYLDLTYNDLTGTVPALPPTLQVLYLNGNRQLGGTIPTLPNSLTVLYLYYTNIGGNIPTLPSQIQYVALGYQPLTGSIPALPDSLVYFGVEYTPLAGSIPPLPATLKRLAVDNNQLTGGIPALPTTLELLWLNDNQLTGLIPSSITGTVLSSLLLCGTGNDLGSDDPAVNAFINARNPNWSPQNSCLPRLSVVSLNHVALDPTSAGVNSVDVVLSKLALLPSFTVDDVSLKIGGSPIPLDSRVTVALVDAGTHRYRIYGLFDFTRTPGVYQLTVNAAGITDRFGLQSSGNSSSTTFSILAQPLAPVIPQAGSSPTPPQQHAPGTPPPLQGIAPGT